METKEHRVIERGHQREVVVHARNTNHALRVAAAVSQESWDVTHETGDGWIVEPLDMARGAEAEDLRRELEALIEDSPTYEITVEALQSVLERVDARDSLAFLLAVEKGAPATPASRRESEGQDGD